MIPSYRYNFYELLCITGRAIGTYFSIPHVCKYWGYLGWHRPPLGKKRRVMRNSCTITRTAHVSACRPIRWGHNMTP